MKHLMIRSNSQVGDLVIRGRSQEQNSSDNSRGRSKSINKDKIYKYCKKKGHIKSKYYKLQNRNKRAAANQNVKQPEKSSKVDVVEDHISRELLIAFDDDSKTSEEWILDSGCTFHICPNRD